MRNFLARVVIVVISLFVIPVSIVLAQDACEGNFDYDKDVDGGDASLFKSDFGRSAFSNPCPLAGPAPVPKTGQTTVYESRDDGYWQQAVGVPWPDPRFTDNGDGTVTDNLTGLIWLKDANCASFGSPVDWTNALSDSNGLADGQCGLTDGSNSGDWRLPNYNELISLIDSSNGEPALPTGHTFLNVQFTHYWTSTTQPLSDHRCFSVHLGVASVAVQFKSDDFYVLPVRGGQ